MHCSKCGALNAESSVYCYSCGNELAHEEKVSEPPNTSTTSNLEVISDVAAHKAESVIQNKQKGTSNVDNKTSKRDVGEGIPDALRIVFALLACFGVYMVYVIIGVFLGWKRGGGIIPMMIMFAIMGYVWTTITGTGKQKDK